MAVFVTEHVHDSNPAQAQMSNSPDNHDYEFVSGASAAQPVAVAAVVLLVDHSI